MSSPTDRFACVVTGYPGHEEEVLALRNANREHEETRQYLDWRYASTGGGPEPKVFWLLSQDGARVGMAAVIFRPYWVSGAFANVAVVGDISVDAALRGRGLGQLLLRFMTQYLDEQLPGTAALVIPTEAARRSLAAVGWKTVGNLVPYVFPVNLTGYIRAFVPSHSLAALLAGPLASLAHWRAARHVLPDRTLTVSAEIDDCLLRFWAARPRPPGATRDLGPESLRWRYLNHPRSRFEIAALTSSAALVGSMIFERSEADRAVWIYDLAAASEADLACMLALYVMDELVRADPKSVRVLLSERHPYARCLRRVGFIARRPTAVYQVHSRSAVAERLTWSVTLGDKDT